jgi:hypothetical protein
MAIGFRVYIDESGDEGFCFEKGSSAWFVLSAVVTREDADIATVKLVDDVREKLGKKPRYTLHFRELQHPHRLPYVDAISRARLRAVSVLVHKPTIQEPEKFGSEPHLLYRFATRYLLERVSWLCRDHRKNEDDTAKIYFSNRAAMSYDYIRDYLNVLKSNTGMFDVRIDWTAFSDPPNITSAAHSSMMGLQIADAVASSLFYACEKTRLGYNEPRYAEMLSPIFYRRSGKLLGYGLKFWPREANQCVGHEFNWLHKMK